MLKTYIPKAAELQKHIAMFYIFTDTKPEKFSYYVFPHTYTNISFIKNASIYRDGNQIIITSDESRNNLHAAEITSKYTRPLTVSYTGSFDEISIVFKPLGVNYFFDTPISSVITNYTQALESKEWLNACKTCFTYSTIDERLAFIEAFLIQNLMPKNYNLLEQAIALLENTDNDYSLEDIAQKLGVSAKTLTRKFQQELCCTPSEYKRIARFRVAVNTRLLNTELKSLTDLSYQSNFYDQSYFIKEFKKLTRLNPKKFFDTISAFEENKIIWEIR